MGRKEKEGVIMVYVVGLGPGSSDYMLPKAIEILKSSDVILGFNRAVESLSFITTEKHIVNGLSEVLEFINKTENKIVAIAASGDPCFYGIVDYLMRNYTGALEVVPGISSFQYFTAKLRKSWQGSFLGSLHGRSEDFLEKVTTNKLSIWLTDKTNTPAKLCEALVTEGIQAKVYVGENLSYEDEKIVEGTPADLAQMTFGDLSVVIIERV